MSLNDALPSGRAPRRCAQQVTAVVVGFGLLVAACGDDSSSDPAPAEEGGADAVGADALDDPRWAQVVLGPAEAEGTPSSGGSLVVGLNAEPPHLSPANWTSGDFNPAFALFDPLAARDADGVAQPYLAESIEPDAELTEWTVQLRPDVTFHDGTAFDADALVRIFEDHLSAAALAQVDDVVERLEVDGDLTVTYVLTEPHAQFAELLTTPIGWPFSPDAADEAGEDFGGAPVGTGPFSFVSWQRDGDLVLERNEDYWQDGLPYLDELTFRALPDETARADSLASGSVDAVQGVGLSPFAADVAAIDDVRLSLGPTSNGRGVVFNATDPPTDDLRVRQALAHAVNQEQLLEVAAGAAVDLSELRTQFFVEGSPYYSEAVADAWLTQDTATASDLLQQYMDDPARSDGREVGEPVEVALSTVSEPASVELATAYADFYAEVGFEAEVERLDQAAVPAAAISGDYQALLFRMGDDRSPLGELLLSFGPPELPTNYSGFNDDVLDDILDRLSTADDLEAQVALAEEMGLHLAEQVPWQWLGSSITFVATGEGVEGVHSWVLPDGSLGGGARRGITFWGQVWMDDDSDDDRSNDG